MRKMLWVLNKLCQNTAGINKPGGLFFAHLLETSTFCDEFM
jgi:hypothetical protein